MPGRRGERLRGETCLAAATATGQRRCAAPARARPRAPRVRPSRRRFVFCCFNNTYKFTPRGVRRLDAAAAAGPAACCGCSRRTATPRRNLRREARRAAWSPSASCSRRGTPGASRAPSRWPTCSSTRSPTTRTRRRAMRCGRAFRCSPARATRSRRGWPRASCRPPACPSWWPPRSRNTRHRARSWRASRRGWRALRERLRECRTASPLFDAGELARNLESAYATMVETHRRGETPRSFRVG